MTLPSAAAIFAAKAAAANRQARSRIAKRCERCAGEPMLTRHLTHHLHQSPGKRAGAGLAFVGYRAANELRLYVTRIESRLIAHCPAIPSRFLLDDAANQFGLKRLRESSLVRQSDKADGRAYRAACEFI